MGRKKQIGRGSMLRKKPKAERKPKPKSQAPTKCMYCDGTDPNCGFCETGKPLDTQEDWDNSWGKIFNERRKGT